MRAAHQGVPVAGVPNAQGRGFFSNLIQAASQAGPPAGTAAPAGTVGRPATTRSSAARPEAASGLDGWLTERLFGR
jgi:penicillin-binding protein 1A